MKKKKKNKDASPNKQLSCYSSPVFLKTFPRLSCPPPATYLPTAVCLARCVVAMPHVIFSFTVVFYKIQLFMLLFSPASYYYYFIFCLCAQFLSFLFYFFYIYMTSLCSTFKREILFLFICYGSVAFTAPSLFLYVAMCHVSYTIAVAAAAAICLLSVSFFHSFYEMKCNVQPRGFCALLFSIELCYFIKL